MVCKTLVTDGHASVIFGRLAHVRGNRVFVVFPLEVDPIQQLIIRRSPWASARSRRRPWTGASSHDSPSGVRAAGVFASPRAVLTRFTGVSSTIIGLTRSLFPDRPPSFSLFAYDSSRFAFAFAFAFAARLPARRRALSSLPRSPVASTRVRPPRSQASSVRTARARFQVPLHSSVSPSRLARSRIDPIQTNPHQSRSSYASSLSRARLLRPPHLHRRFLLLPRPIASTVRPLARSTPVEVGQCDAIDIDRSIDPRLRSTRLHPRVPNGRWVLDRETRARDAMDAMDARSIVRAIVRDRSRSVDVERPSRDIASFRVVSETARKFKRALFRAFFGEGLGFVGRRRERVERIGDGRRGVRGRVVMVMRDIRKVW